MASVNKVILIGRLGKDPEVRMFASGGKVANFSLAVEDRKKNSQTGQWESETLWVRCTAFNSQYGQKLADLAEQYLFKGHLVYIEGRLKEDKWTDQNGVEQRRMNVVLNSMQFLQQKQKNDAAPPSGPVNDGPPVDMQPPIASHHPDRTEEEIPFAWAGLLIPLLWMFSSI